MPTFGLFRKRKKEEAVKTEQALPPQEPEKIQVPAEEPPKEEPQAIPQEPNAEAEPKNKTYLKAMPLREITDLESIKNEVKNGNILILRITPLASKSIDDVKNAVNELYQFTESIGGDIARLGEERVVICPKNIKIWR
jgi:SepF-like predicted cell division protein (DUF552 family)